MKICCNALKIFYLLIESCIISCITLRRTDRYKSVLCYDKLTYKIHKYIKLFNINTYCSSDCWFCCLLCICCGFFLCFCLNCCLSRCLTFLFVSLCCIFSFFLLSFLFLFFFFCLFCRFVKFSFKRTYNCCLDFRYIFNSLFYCLKTFLCKVYETEIIFKFLVLNILNIWYCLDNFTKFLKSLKY